MDPEPAAYRFGVSGLPSSLPELGQSVGRYEELGFDFVAEGDHVGGLSPFSLLTAAAAVSERLRLRIYVLNAMSELRGHPVRHAALVLGTRVLGLGIVMQPGCEHFFLASAQSQSGM